MQYLNNVAFSIRSLLMYREFKKSRIYSDYEFTLTGGALLNALSAIVQKNDHIVIDPALLLKQDFPQLDEKNVESLKNHFRQIRDALAVKTEDESFICEKLDGEIVELIVHTKNDTPKKHFSIKDLEKTLDSLEEALKISDQYKELYTDEKRKFEENTRRVK